MRLKLAKGSRISPQPLSKTITCLGDGHDGVWNIVEQIGSKHQRREILDWYHLMENLHKVGGSNQRLRQARNYLWYGLVEDAISLFDELDQKQAKNFVITIFANTPLEFLIINFISSWGFASVQVQLNLGLNRSAHELKSLEHSGTKKMCLKC